MASDTKQEANKFDTTSNASSTTCRANTLPTTAETSNSLWSGPGAVPWPENTFQIIEKHSGRAITVVGDRAKLQSLEHTSHLDIHWLCVKQDGYFGFQNPQTGRYLGHDNKGGICTSVFHLKDWDVYAETTPRRRLRALVTVLLSYPEDPVR